MKTIRPFLLLFISFFLFSCDSEEETIEAPTIPDKIKIYYSDDVGKTFSGEYEGVRIGEYYWMNSNFNHIKGHNVKRSDIEKIFKIYKLDPAQFDISMEDFNKYFGSYYTRPAFENIVNNGFMYEIDEVGEKDLKGEWDVPNVEDFQQLFGMCGDAKVDAVMRFLSCEVGDNPAAKDISGSGWVAGFSRNIYGFNLMPTGAIFNGPGKWKPYEEEVAFDVSAGDMYGLYQAVLFPAHGEMTVSIHDYVATDGGKLWHYMPMRWCRKLSDDELGYKLFIDKDQTDIVELKLDENPPLGYKELPKGYLRGFYVQYILDKKKPQKTVKEIVEMTKGLR